MRGAFFLLLALIAAAALVVLERDRWQLAPQRVQIGATPAMLWTPPVEMPGAPVVVVAHGFAGSQQMMAPIARDLAFAGFPVLTFDFLGHGRHPLPLSGDVTVIEGTTALLVNQTAEVAEAAMRLSGVNRVALVGHSMATDVVIRAAQRLDDVPAVVAISMYSDAVTPAFPPRLLVVSGAYEGRLREVALNALRQIAPDAGEAETVTADGVARRVVAAPGVEHVGVLYSPLTLNETRGWIAGAANVAPFETPRPDWPWRLAILTALVLLFRPATAALPRRDRSDGLALRGGELAAVLAVPILPAAVAALALTWSPTGIAGFASLSAFFAVWGGIQLALLWRFGARPVPPMVGGMALLIVGALAFALVLDRYGAAFIPVGPRWAEMAVLLVGAVPFMAADALIAHRAPVWHRGLARLVLLVVLASVMIADPVRLGTMFTILPVLALFWVVFGSMARWVAWRQGAETAALPMALILAWSIAASTPMFAG